MIGSTQTVIYKVILLTVVIAIALFGLCGALVAIVAANAVWHSSTTVWTAVTNNNILLTTSIISRIPPLLTPVVMGLAAYSYARQWLATSSPPSDGSAPAREDLNPTPEQYTLSLNVIGSASIGALYSSVKYLFQERSARPRWFISSIVSLGVLIFFSYLANFGDLWLHQVVKPATFTTFKTSDRPTTEFSRTINETLCRKPFGGDLNLCSSVILPASSAPFVENLAEGLATAAGSSLVNEVVLLPNTALSLLLPAQSLRGQETYQANTYGMFTTCAPITLECGLESTSSLSVSYGCQEHPAFSGTVWSVPPGQSSTTGFNDSGSNFDGYTDGNPRIQPLEIGVQVSFPSQVGNSSDPQLATVADDASGLMLWCELSILNVTYLHQPSNTKNPIQVQKFDLVSPEDAFTLSGAAYVYDGTGRAEIDAETQGVILHNDSYAFAKIYAQQFSRVILSFAAGMTQASPTLKEFTGETGIRGSQIPLAPLLAFLVVVIFFATSVLYVGLSGSTKGPMLKDWESRDVPAVELARTRLTSAGPIVYELFCPDSGRSGCSTSDRLFRGYTKERIRIGVTSRYSESHFGLTTAQTNPVGEIGGSMVL